MAIVNRVEKRVRMSRQKIIHFQLLTHCHFNNIPMSDSELQCLSILGECGECDLSDFCFNIADKRVFKSSQTVRNTIIKAERYGLILKKGSGRKTISLHPALQLQVNGNILLDFKFASVDTNKTNGSA